MRKLLPFSLLLCAFHGGSSGCEGCAHMGSGFEHVGGGSHFSSGGGGGGYGGGYHVTPSASAGSHFSSGSSGTLSSSHVVAPAAGPSPSAVSATDLATPAPATHFGGAFHLLHSLAAGFEGLEGVVAISGDDGDASDAADAPAALSMPSADGLCRSFADCGDGQLGQGALCDRTFVGGDAQTVGLCRDACRDNADCPAPLTCRSGLDPTDRIWAGCVP